MNKILILATLMMLLSFAAIAQNTPRDRIYRHRVINGYRNGELTAPEVQQLFRQEYRYNITKRRAFRDGIISPMEHRRLKLMKRREHRQLFIKKHNHNRRVI